MVRNVTGRAEQTVSAKLTAVADEFRAEMKRTSGSARDTAQDVHDSGADMERSLTSTGISARDLAGDVSTSAGRMDRSFMEVGGAADRTSNDIRGAGSKIDREISSWDEPVDDFERSLNGISTGGILAALGAVGAAAAGIGSQLLEAFARDAQTDMLGAALGLDEATADRLGRISGEVYAEAWGDSIGEVNTAVEGVWSTLDARTDEDVGRLTRKAMTVADVFNIDVSRAVSSAGILLRSGLVDDADEAFDSIARGMQEMPSHLREELLEASDEYGKFFDDLGFDASEAFALLIDGAEDGMFGIDKAGDAIKEFTIRATDMSSTSEEAFGAIGLDAETMAGRILEGGDTARGAFEEIIEGLLSMEDPVKQSNAAIALFGTPLEDISTSDIPEFLGSLRDMQDGMTDVEGSVDRMADTAYDNISTRWTEAWRSAQQVFLEFADENVVPAVERIVTAFEEDGLAGAMDQVRVEWERSWPQIEGWLNDTVMPALIDFAIEAGGAFAAALGKAILEGFETWGVFFANDFARIIGEGLQVQGNPIAGWVGDQLVDAFPSSGGVLGAPSSGAVHGPAPVPGHAGSSSGRPGGATGESGPFHEGGIVPGYPGQEVWALTEAGEGITSVSDMYGRADPSGSGRSTVTVQMPVHVGGRHLFTEEATIDALAGQIVKRGRERGGGWL